MAFQKAVKFGARGRVALIGVSGSGKSWTMLTLARALAGPSGTIAAIDTEHGSLSKYADHFQFDVDEASSYTTDYLMGQLDYAEKNKYDVFCVDSLSHFWMGKDGALEFVDAAKKRTRDQMEGWKMFRPHERGMVDRFIASPCHIIVTMRVKTDYEEVVGSDGKKKRVKVGLAPVQRDGLEYEFDLVCSMDDENNLLIDKTRCSYYSQDKARVVAKPTARYFQPFIDWLGGEQRGIAAQPTTQTNLNPPMNTAAAQQKVAADKIAHMNNGASYAEASERVSADMGIPDMQVEEESDALSKQLKASVESASTSKNFEMLNKFSGMKKDLGEALYYKILGSHGYEKSNQIPTREKGAEIYKEMRDALRNKPLEELAASHNGATV